MPDITMCRGEDCPIQKECYRHEATPSEYRQSYFVISPYDKETKSCDHYNQMKKKPDDPK